MRIRFAVPFALLVLSSGLLSGGTALAQKPAASAPASTTGAENPLPVVQRFYEAYNHHDTEAMLAQIHPDIQWLTVNGDQIIGTAAGHNAVRELLAKNLTSYTNLRKTIDQSIIQGSLVSVLEHSQWKGRREDLKQDTLVVYHIEDGKIRHVWIYTYRYKS